MYLKGYSDVSKLTILYNFSTMSVMYDEHIELMTLSTDRNSHSLWPRYLFKVKIGNNEKI